MPTVMSFLDTHLQAAAEVILSAAAVIVLLNMFKKMKKNSGVVN